MKGFPKLAALLLVGALVVVILLLGQSFLEARRLFLVAGAALVAFAVPPMLIAVRRGALGLLDARLFGALGIFVFLVWGMVYSSSFSNALAGTSVGTALKGILVTASCLLGFVVGCWLGLRPRSLGPMCRYPLSTARLLVWTLLLGLAGLLGLLWFSNPLNPFDPTIPNYLRIMSHGLPAAGFLAIWLLFTVQPRTPARKLLFYAALIPIPLVATLSGSRVPLFVIVGFAYLVFVYRVWARRPHSFPYGRMAVFTAAITLALLVSMALSDILTAERWQAMDKESLFEGARERLGSVDAFENLVYSITIHPEQEAYLYGWTVVGVVVNPIPRSVWPDKPYGYGRLLAEERGMASIRGHSLAASLAGELWANFGYFGPFLGYLLLGIIASSLHRRFLQAQPFSPFHVLYLASLMFFLLESRGDLLSINNRALPYLFFMYVILRLSLKRLPEAQPIRGPVWSPAPTGR